MEEGASKWQLFIQVDTYFDDSFIPIDMADSDAMIDMFKDAQNVFYHKKK